MVPKPMWNRTAWEGMMTNLGLPWEDEPCYNGEALMSALGMTDLNGNNRDTLFKLIYKLALNKLCDKDKVFNIRDYFKL